MMRQYIQITVIAASLGGLLLAQTRTRKPAAKFQVVAATIDDIHAAMGSEKLTARQVGQAYCERIVAFDKQGPALNCIINLNPQALEEADKLDAAFKRSGKVRSEEHTSELQSLAYLVCRLLLEKKKKKQHTESEHTVDTARGNRARNSY